MYIQGCGVVVVSFVHWDEICFIVCTCIIFSKTNKTQCFSLASSCINPCRYFWFYVSMFWHILLWESSVEPTSLLLSESKACFKTSSCRTHVENPFPFTWWEEVLGLYELWGEGKVCCNGNNTTKSIAAVAAVPTGPLYSETYWPRFNRKVVLHMISFVSAQTCNFCHFSI